MTSAILRGQANEMDKAYAALRGKSYEAAIEAFQKALSAAPANANIRKELGYTYLRVGETEAARDQFGEAFRLNPSDNNAAMEYAFLCNDTHQVAVARRIFDRIRTTGNQVAEDAFQNIDRPLTAGISRWKQAVAMTPDNFSAHEELARLAEQRDDLTLAAEQFEKAWRLRPQMHSLLLDLGRVWKALGRAEQANAALLSASRVQEPRVAEAARELLPNRYPFVYEFLQSLALDPSNVDLRRELAYLHLEMGKRDEAEQEFRKIHAAVPDDALTTAQLGFLMLAKNDVAGAMPLLDQVLKSGDPALIDRVKNALRVPASLRRRPEGGKSAEPAPTASADDAKSLGEKSLRAGYLKDALKYLTIAHEQDPNDYAVMLKLGWANNMMRDDHQAVEWFRLARESPDPNIAREAAEAYRNLRPSQAPIRTTVWTFPFYSSRWKDVFAYSQIKTEFKIGNLPVHPYLSARIIGDTRNTIESNAVLTPQYLSESSIIVGVGLATQTYKGITAWGEAGEAIRYRERKDVGRMIPDYRGGVSFGRSWGTNLGAERRGLFGETADDGVFVSRFQNDFIVYSQNHVGYTLKKVQLYWNTNLTFDANRQYWANFWEQGPGMKFRIPGMPNGLSFSVNAVRGTYLVQQGNPRGPIFYDLRAGFWYAFTH